MSDEKRAELSATERKPRGKPFPKGKSGNPGGQSREKRAFLERLKADDPDTIYASFMELVREKNPQAVLRAVEYLAGKPPAAEEDNDALRDGLTVVVQQIRGGR